MPRSARSSSRRGPKRPTKWCGAAATGNVPNEAGLIVADAIPLCAVGTAEIIDVADPVIGWCRGGISLSRLAAADANSAVAWAIVKQRVDVATSTPVQVFNPWAVADLERQDILGMGHFALPPVVLTPSSDAAVIDRSTTTVEINIKVGRKMPRNTNGLFLWLVGISSDDAFKFQANVRSLMKF